MSGRPGDGCDDPRDVHPHWCGTCGAEKLFSRAECTSLRFVPPCPRCQGDDWRTEIDGLTSPDYRGSGVSEVIQHLVVMVGVALTIGGLVGMVLHWEERRAERRRSDEEKRS